ncbi:MAG: exodeoxyribonuclease VII small subunit [Oscillospiraceae bacterium]
MGKISDFEKDMASLEDILNKLQDENTTLDETLTMYASAAALISTCNKTLNDAKLKIDEISEQIENKEV